MAMMVYSTLSRALELEPHYHKQFSDIPHTRLDNDDDVDESVLYTKYTIL